MWTPFHGSDDDFNLFETDAVFLTSAFARYRAGSRHNARKIFSERAADVFKAAAKLFLCAKSDLSGGLVTMQSNARQTTQRKTVLSHRGVQDT